ncbi:MAG: hypothetical protein RL748_803, partial [Pseudomonadota bacterium]
METHVSASAKRNNQQPTRSDQAAMQSAGQQGAFADRRSEMAKVQALRQLMESSRHIAETGVLQAMMNNSHRVREGGVLQALMNDSLQGRDVLAVQAKATDRSPAQAAAMPNHTGLPDNLKSGIETLSGMRLDHVKVHYNSSQPAQLNALAYAQGSEIHVAPGQEQHLAHEAWHVVQQAQGRVTPTMQMKAGVAINDDAALEREADIMGGKAWRMGSQPDASMGGMHPSISEHHADDAIAQRQSMSQGSPVTVLQLVETLEQKVQRILKSRNIIISEQEAAEYAHHLTSNPENTLIPVKGRHRALKLNHAGVVSSVQWRPPSDASRMRVSAMSGPMEEDESSMLTEGPRPLTGEISSQDASIAAASLADIPPRDQLGKVMGGSAAQLSGIENSEWLHLVAHSLGGADLP